MKHLHGSLVARIGRRTDRPDSLLHTKLLHTPLQLIKNSHKATCHKDATQHSKEGCSSASKEKKWAPAALETTPEAEWSSGTWAWTACPKKSADPEMKSGTGRGSATSASAADNLARNFEIRCPSLPWWRPAAAAAAAAAAAWQAGPAGLEEGADMFRCRSSGRDPSPPGRKIKWANYYV